MRRSLDHYGPWALIVGASDGIGAAFATVLAEAGLDLILVARRHPPLEALADRLRSDHGVRVRTIAVDAGSLGGLDVIGTLDEEIGLVICNAALAPIGPFLDLTPEQLDGMLDLNCRSALQLSHVYGARLRERGRGGVILLSSLASNQGAAGIAHYSATKAYLRVLAEGLWAEWRPSGVDVLAVCPGLVRTPTYEREHPSPGWLVPPPLEPVVVAREALAALGKGPVLVPGRRNKITAALARLIPRRLAIRVASDQTAAMYSRR